MLKKFTMFERVGISADQLSSRFAASSTDLGRVNEKGSRVLSKSLKLSWEGSMPQQQHLHRFPSTCG